MIKGGYATIAMSESEFAEYLHEVRALLDARAKTPNGEIDQDHEAKWAEKLDELWNLLTPDEQQRAEVEIERLKSSK